MDLCITYDYSNVKYFDVFICDTYKHESITYIPAPETTQQPFYDAVLKGVPASAIVLISKN